MATKQRRGRGRPRIAENAFAKWIDVAGLTREHVAKSVGISKSSVDRYCRDERTPTLEAALAIEKLTSGAVPARCWIPRSR